MEPGPISALAAGVLSLLSPYLKKIADKTVDKIADQLPAAASKLWTAIQNKFASKPAAQESLSDMIKYPEREAYQTVFQVQLEKAMGEDESFALLLQDLLKEAKPQMSQQATVIGDGTVVQGNGNTVVGAGGFMVGRDVKGDVNIGSQVKPKNDSDQE